MRRIVFRRPSPALVVAVIALLVALGGTSIAAGGGPLAGSSTSSDNRSDKRIAKKVAKRVVKSLAPRLRVAYAKKAGTATSATTAGSAPPPAALPRGVTLRGEFSVRDNAAVAGEEIQSPISFGLTLASAPTAHYINSGTAVPAGCSGTPENPGADPGNLCIFEASVLNSTVRGEFDSVSGLDDAAQKYGAAVFAQSAAAGAFRIRGSWAVTSP
jgi:hypothetical protein